MRNLLILCLFSNLALAIPPASENYKLSCSQFLSGFSSASSQRYSLKSSVAPSDFSGIRASNLYTLESGCTTAHADLAISTTQISSATTDFSLMVVTSYNAFFPLNGAILDIQLTGGISTNLWNCLASTGVTCTPNSGSGVINTSIDFEPGAILQLRVDIDTQDFILSTAQIALPNGSPDSNPTNDSFELTLPYFVIFSDGFE